MRCTLEDPQNKFDVRIERDDKGSSILRFDGGCTANESSTVVLDVNNFTEGKHPLLYDSFIIEIKDTTSQHNKHKVGYLRAEDIKYLAPFFKENGTLVKNGKVHGPGSGNHDKDLFSAKIHRLNPEIGGSAGINISIYIN
jgi:hypothetical protein